MKNFIWLIALLFVSVQHLSAQDDGEKLAKRAKKSITNFYLDPTNKDNLKEAKEQIDKAFSTGTIDSDGTAWNTKAEIYSELGRQDMGMKLINPDAQAAYPDAAGVSFDAFTKAIDLAPKESGKKKALEGVLELIPVLSNSGLDAFYAQDFARAYNDFNNVLKAHEWLNNAKMKSPLAKSEDLANQYYITGLAALNNGMEAEAGELLDKSLENGNQTAEVYDGLFRTYLNSDPEKAEQYLAVGRQKFPNDNNLLFSEINLYLQQNKLEALLDKLQLAITKEPDNVSVINTLGNVYDKLYQTEIENGNTDKAQMYFDKSMENYQMSLSKDPNNNFANYSMGTLYYNKAAVYVKSMNEVADDMSKEGMKKYGEYEKQMFDMFDAALPYFLKAEASDANDKNTLIALREIYARQNNIVKSNEYKEKLESME